MNFKDYLTSPPFEFIVGAHRRSFFVNASLVASQSKPLTSLVSGGGSSPHGGHMRESLERRAILNDVDEDTFARFVEFALTNSYTPAEPCEYISENEDGDEGEEWSGDDDMEEEGEEGSYMMQQQHHHVDNMAFTEIPSNGEGSSRKRRKGRKKESTTRGSSKRTKSNSNYKFPPSPVSSARGAESDSEHHSRTRSDVSMMMLNTSAPPNLTQSPPTPVMYGRFTPTGPVFTHQPPPNSGMQKRPPPPYHAKSGARQQPFSFPSLPFAAAPPTREVPRPRQNEVDDDCTPVFLSHAKLYVFAEIYDVTALRALCLHNLHTSLSTYRIYSDAEGGHGAKEVVNLINYAYENTMEDEGEELRKLVSWFCAWRAKKLLGCKFYCGCLEVGGMGVGFVGDLMGKLVSMAPGCD